MGRNTSHDPHWRQHGDLTQIQYLLNKRRSHYFFFKEDLNAKIGGTFLV